MGRPEGRPPAHQKIQGREDPLTQDFLRRRDRDTVMDPLARLKEARLQGVLPDKVCDLVLRRFAGIVVPGIDRIERTTGMAYPAAYVEPAAVISPAAQFGYGVLFARTVPVVVEGDFRVVVQISAPLVAYGLKGAVHAILSHEFLHYLELMRRIHRGDLLSDVVTGNLFESVYADESRTLEPGAVFDDRTLVSHIRKRFDVGFRDSRLEKKVVEQWINRGLPKISVLPDMNTASIPAESLSSVRLPSETAQRLEEMHQKSVRIRSRRRLY